MSGYPYSFNASRGDETREHPQHKWPEWRAATCDSWHRRNTYCYCAKRRTQRAALSAKEITSYMRAWPIAMQEWAARHAVGPQLPARNVLFRIRAKDADLRVLPSVEGWTTVEVLSGRVL